MQALDSFLVIVKRRIDSPQGRVSPSLPVIAAVGALLCALIASSAFARPLQEPSVIDAPAWIIDAWPQAECSGWWVDFTGSNSVAEQWRVKLDGVVIASGTTRGNETVSGQWPTSVDLSVARTFSVEVFEGGVWIARSDANGVGPCGPGKCVTIQRGRFGAVNDAYVYQAFPNANYGGAVVLYTGSVNNYPHYSLLWFDLSAIPANAPLTQATLTLQMDEASGTAGPSGRAINVHRITSAWSEAAVTWTNFASQFDATVWSSFNAGNTPVQVDFDVRTLVAGWLSGAFANRGLLLNHASGTLRERYHSSEVSSNSLRAYRPKLEVCYGAILGDRVWYDTNANGVQDIGESGADGVTVTLLDAGGAPLRTTVTAGGGLYRFIGLLAGDYRLQFTPPTGYALSPQNVGMDDALDSDPDPFTGLTGLINLTLDETDLTWDAGLQQAGSIGDTVFYDDNRNGQQDSNPPNPETGIAGVTVQLYTDAGGDCNRLVASAVTNAVGGYLFSGLPAGHYCVVVPETQAENPFLIGLERTAGLNPFSLNLPTGGQRLDADFGYAGFGAIRGVVYFDTNQDGVQGLGEPGIPDVQVCLYADSNGDGQPDAGGPLACVATDSAGAYIFPNRLPGRYVLTETDPQGLTSTTPNNIVTQLVVVQGSGLSDRNDFGDTATANYVITKQLLSPSPTRPGQSVQYEIKIVNTGSAWITFLPLRDLYDVRFLSYVSAAPSPIDQADDGQLDWADLTALFGADLVPGGSFTLLVNFRTLADTSNQPNGVTENRATALSGLADPDGPNRPLGDLLTVGSKSAVAPLQILSPTSLHVSMVQATPTHERIVVNWTTTTEADVEGFNVFRSVNSEPFERRNLDVIPARRPNNGGAEYRWEDFAVTPDAVYVYRIEVVLVDGRVELAEMAPVTLQSTSFLPLVAR